MLLRQPLQLVQPLLSYFSSPCLSKRHSRRIVPCLRRITHLVGYHRSWAATKYHQHSLGILIVGNFLITKANARNFPLGSKEKHTYLKLCPRRISKYLSRVKTFEVRSLDVEDLPHYYRHRFWRREKMIMGSPGPHSPDTCANLR